MKIPPVFELENIFTIYVPEKRKYSKKNLLFTFSFIFDNLGP